MKTNRRSFFRSLLAAFTGSLLPLSVMVRAQSKSVNTLTDSKNMANNRSEPKYLKLFRNGELEKRGEALWDMMESCTLCPRDCKTNRLENNRGRCNANSEVEVASVSPHFGEEPPLVGRNGSGTVFFTNCGLKCVFCINADISQGGLGEKRTIKELANNMLLLQRIGCHNINVVTPSHYSPHIVLALNEAAKEGLNLPLVYNTCGWEKREVLELLDGVVDIYLTDFKYYDSEMADKYSPGAASYPEVTKEAVLEMHRQVGIADASPDSGIMSRGLIIRHLVMPNDVGGSTEVVKWIADNLPNDTYVNIMSQYMPVHKADQYAEISRRITSEEYNEVVEAAKNAGLTNLDTQPVNGLK